MNTSDFESIFASVIQLARITYIEVPSIAIINQLYSFYSTSSLDTPYDSFISLIESLYEFFLFIHYRQNEPSIFMKIIEEINTELELSNLGTIHASIIEENLHRSLLVIYSLFNRYKSLPSGVTTTERNRRS